MAPPRLVALFVAGRRHGSVAIREISLRGAVVSGEGLACAPGEAAEILAVDGGRELRIATHVTASGPNGISLGFDRLSPAILDWVARCIDESTRRGRSTG